MSRLATAPSAYLRSAAHQPVDWHPWGPEAFARARGEDKPILLDVGAVWCHWCHVMDRESYEDPGIAERLNRDWVCIKVDRDERPDVDARYQRAVQAITGQGGWPLTAFLTPDGEVFYGGTYFPPDGKFGRAGFGSVLHELGRVYRDEREKLVEQAGMIRRHMSEHGEEPRPGPVTPDLLTAATDGIARVFDFRYGGFGNAPKFPHPTALDFLLARWIDTGQPWPREMVDRTLSAMAGGGMYDHVGGGFHRYSTDARWVVPHFEKMAYDNSELLRVYVHAAASLPAEAEGAATADSPSALYHRTVSGIVHWVLTALADPAGGYYASQDADVGLDDDGDYFTWTVDEVRAVVADREFEALVRRFDIEERGEMQHDSARNVLWIKRSWHEIAASLDVSDDAAQALVASGTRKLADARARRAAPVVDRTIYTGWSAMMASAMLEAAAFLDRPDAERHALDTLDRLFGETADPAGGVRHAIGGAVGGLLDDQVHLADAAIDAYEATGEHRWIDRAVSLMEHVWAEFRAPGGGLRDRRGMDGEGFLTQSIVPVLDAPTPSPNGVAALVLSRLDGHRPDGPWAAHRDELLAALGGAVADLGLHGATLLRAADAALNPTTHVVVVAGDDDRGRALRRAARTAYRPRKIITPLAPGAPADGLPPAVRAALDGKVPRAYVCVGTTCHAPLDEPATLLDALRGAP